MKEPFETFETFSEVRKIKQASRDQVYPPGKSAGSNNMDRNLSKESFKKNQISSQNSQSPSKQRTEYLEKLQLLEDIRIKKLKALEKLAKMNVTYIDVENIENFENRNCGNYDNSINERKESRRNYRGERSKTPKKSQKTGYEDSQKDFVKTATKKRNEHQNRKTSSIVGTSQDRSISVERVQEKNYQNCSLKEHKKEVKRIVQQRQALKEQDRNLPQNSKEILKENLSHRHKKGRRKEPSNISSEKLDSREMDGGYWKPSIQNKKPRKMVEKISSKQSQFRNESVQSNEGSSTSNSFDQFKDSESYSRSWSYSDSEPESQSPVKMGRNDKVSEADYQRKKHKNHKRNNQKVRKPKNVNSNHSLDYPSEMPFPSHRHPRDLVGYHNMGGQSVPNLGIHHHDRNCGGYDPNMVSYSDPRLLQQHNQQQMLHQQTTYQPNPNFYQANPLAWYPNQNQLPSASNHFPYPPPPTTTHLQQPPNPNNPLPNPNPHNLPPLTQLTQMPLLLPPLSLPHHLSLQQSIVRDLDREYQDTKQRIEGALYRGENRQGEWSERVYTDSESRGAKISEDEEYLSESVRSMKRNESFDKGGFKPQIDLEFRDKELISSYSKSSSNPNQQSQFSFQSPEFKKASFSKQKETNFKQSSHKKGPNQYRELNKAQPSENKVDISYEFGSEIAHYDQNYSKDSFMEYENQQPDSLFNGNKQKPSEAELGVNHREQMPSQPLEVMEFDFGKSNSNKKPVSLAEAFKREKSQVARRISQTKNTKTLKSDKVVDKEELIQKRKLMKKVRPNGTIHTIEDLAALEKEKTRSQSPLPKPCSQPPLPRSSSALGGVDPHLSQPLAFSIPASSQPNNSALPPQELLDRLSRGHRPGMNRREMLDLNRRHIKNLPEIKERERERERKEEGKKRQQRMREYDRGTRINRGIIEG